MASLTLANGPLYWLPSDVQGEIFCHCVEGDDIPSDVFGDPVESTVLKLGLVCKHWRDMVLNHSGLWSFLSMDLTLFGPWVHGDGNRFMDWLDIYLARSGNCALTLRIKDVGGPVISRLLVESHRWRSVSLSCPRGIHFIPVLDRGFEALEELTIEGGGVQEFHDAPRLRSVTLRDVLRLPSVIPWAQITDLTCASSKFTMIQNCLQLRRLTFETSKHDLDNGPSSSHNLTSNLEFLSIAHHGYHSNFLVDHSGSFLDRWTLPLLQSLSISTTSWTTNSPDSWPPHVKYVSLLNRSQCQLTSLYLKAPITAVEFLELVASQPTLEKIKVSDHENTVLTITGSVLQSLARTSGTSTDLLPRLTHIELALSAEIIPFFSTLLELLQSRFETSRYHPSLQTIPLQSVALGFIYHSTMSLSARSRSTKSRLKDLSGLLGHEVHHYSSL